jgi:hypothetical protein
MSRKVILGTLLIAPLVLGLGWICADVHGDADGQRPTGAPQASAKDVDLSPLELELDPVQVDLLRRLDQPATASFRKVPLQKALTTLGKQAGVHFILDADALEQARIDEDAPVSGQFEKTPLYRTVERLLHDYPLEMCLSGEAVLITDAATAKDQVWTRSYPVVDVAVVPTDKRPRFLGQELVALIQDSIAPESWDDMDGPGFVTFETINFSLVVTQSLRTHKSIERFLAMLRKNRDRLDAFCQAKAAPPKQQLWNSYFSPPQELRRMYETLILLEEGTSPGIVGWTASTPSDRLVPAAARRLAAKALAFAQEVEEDLEAEALDKDGGKEPVWAKAPPATAPRRPTVETGRPRRPGSRRRTAPTLGAPSDRLTAGADR